MEHLGLFLGLHEPEQRGVVLSTASRRPDSCGEVVDIALNLASGGTIVTWCRSLSHSGDGDNNLGDFVGTYVECSSARAPIAIDVLRDALRLVVGNLIDAAGLVCGVA